MSIKQKIKNILGISDLEKEISALTEENKNLSLELDRLDRFQANVRRDIDLITRFSTADMDLPCRRGDSGSIILTGRFNGRDYVKVYDTSDMGFWEIKKTIEALSRTHEIRHIDSPFGFPVGELRL